MPAYKGRHRLVRDGVSAGEGACHIEFHEERFTLAPDAGAAVAMDLADLDWLRAADYEIHAGLYTGEQLILTHLGKLFTEASEKLREAWRERLVKALLLSDLPLLETFRGSVRAPADSGAGRAGELRIYEGGVVALPDEAAPFHVRMADIDSVSFDADAWEVHVATRRGGLAFGKLGKRTDLFRRTLDEALASLRALSAQALHDLFPFLTPANSQKLGAAWREGGLVSRTCLEAIDARVWPSLLERAIGEKHRAYAEHLASLSDPALIHVSFKRVRDAEAADTEEPGDGDADAPETEAGAQLAAEPAAENGAETQAPAAENGAETQAPAAENGAETQAPAAENGAEAQAPAIFSFFYPVKKGATARLVAQEVTSAGGRATYWFRLDEPVVASLAELNDGLALLNFRRQPIYLPEEKIYADPRYRRYAAALRRIPELRAVRERFVGRSIHTSLDSWKSQISHILT